MTLAEYSLVAFAVLNGGRIFAYLPQMILIYRDPNGAAAVSIAAWSLFAASNLATVGYVVIVAHDWIVAGVFAMNAAGCVGIVALTLFKRQARGSRFLSAGRRIASALRPRVRCVPAWRDRDVV